MKVYKWVNEDIHLCCYSTNTGKYNYHSTLSVGATLKSRHSPVFDKKFLCIFYKLPGLFEEDISFHSNSQQ